MKSKTAENLCACGKPLHYTNERTEARVKELVDLFGEFVNVTVAGRTWRVQRHYIALHGLKARELPDLGFKELQNAYA